MSEITREGRIYAEQCRADGQDTMAEKLLHLCDWIEVCEHTIRAQKLEIAEMRREIGEKSSHPLAKRKAPA